MTIDDDDDDGGDDDGDANPNAQDAPAVLSFLLKLTFQAPGVAYSTDGLPASQKGVVRDVAKLGLLYPLAAAGKGYYVPTSLSSGLSGGGGGDDDGDGGDDDDAAAASARGHRRRGRRRRGSRRGGAEPSGVEAVAIVPAGGRSEGSASIVLARRFRGGVGGLGLGLGLGGGRGRGRGVRPVQRGVLRRLVRARHVRARFRAGEGGAGSRRARGRAREG
jgi:hypothetical protein